MKTCVDIASNLLMLYETTIGTLVREPETAVKPSVALLLLVRNHLNTVGTQVDTSRVNTLGKENLVSTNRLL